MPQEKIQRVSTGYSPRPLQEEMHNNLKRFNVIVAHRRFGKSVFCLNELIHQCLKNDKPMPRYGYMAPLLSQGKKIAWDYLKAYTRNIPGTTFNEQELRADLPGGRRIFIIGADNPDSHRGTYFDGVVIDEYAQCNPMVWQEVLRPALSDRKGFAIFIGTPKGRNAFYALYQWAKKQPHWYTKIFKASETGIIDADELAQLKGEMGDDSYNQEYECDFSANVAGTYYGKEMGLVESSGRILRVPYDPSLGVITAWDIGIGDSCVIWFAQRLFREVRLIDYLEVDGIGVPEISKLLKEKPYAYTTHLLPHDAQAREFGTGKSRVETLMAHGIRADVVPKLSVEDGINAARNLMAMSWFDAEKCERGIECLREYRREWDDKANMFKNKPSHNEFSHGADGFRYLAVGIDKERPLISPKRQERAEMNYDELAYEER